MRWSPELKEKAELVAKYYIPPIQYCLSIFPETDSDQDRTAYI